MTEQQVYSAIRRLSDSKIELRRYATCVVADVIVLGDYRNSTFAGFRPLFNYISRHNIAMTAPVLQEAERSDAWRVSFVMPAGRTNADLPVPHGSEVTLREVPEHTAAAISFAGVSTPQVIARQERRLRAALSAEGITPVGDIRIARFDPPWKPGFLRHNEVVLEVRL